MLGAGEVSSLREISKRDGAGHSYIAQHLNLTLLAPDIVAAILDDALPDGVRLSALLINPPVLWGGSGWRSARRLLRYGRGLLI